MTTPESIAKLLAGPASAQWSLIGTKVRHGINVPLFSLRTKQSSGIGEFEDLLPLGLWLNKLGFNTIQLLPLNDTGHETSPYATLSAFALNPLHLSLASLPHLEKNSCLTSELAVLNAMNALDRIDYPVLHSKREHFLQDYFAFAGRLIEQLPEYQEFISNQTWLKPYALFKSLKIATFWHPWEKWPQELEKCSPRELELLEKKFESEIQFHQMIQFLCFKQFKDVKEKLNAIGIQLMGDIPILINRESADVWFHPELFDLNSAAGAPPDQYSKEGQYWGFPPYNWGKHASTQYAWWLARLQYAANFYNLYRIDHIVGFFRLWTIPLNQNALSGKFNPENSNDWIPHGRHLMEMMLECKGMLPIGEDLGVVPDEVRACLKELGISGTKVMRWERWWHGDRSYIPISGYPLESLTTVSTHDSEPLDVWWKEQKEEASLFANAQGWAYDPYLNEGQRYAILKMSHQTSSLFHINLLAEYLALKRTFVNDNPENERVNIPGTVSNRNWTYKYRVPVEEFTSDEEFSRALKTLLEP